MPEDADANVVKIVVHEEGCIRLIIRQSVAELATSLTVEQFPTALGRIACRNHQRKRSTEQVGDKRRQLAVIALRPAILNGDATTLDIAVASSPRRKGATC